MFATATEGMLVTAVIGMVSALATLLTAIAALLSAMGAMKSARATLTHVKTVQRDVLTHCATLVNAADRVSAELRQTRLMGPAGPGLPPHETGFSSGETGRPPGP